jgi:Vacuolar protein sorting-associated protein 35
MSIEDAPVKEIMKDMMEMSRGVQHPIRYEPALVAGSTSANVLPEACF